MGEKMKAPPVLVAPESALVNPLAGKIDTSLLLNSSRLVTDLQQEIDGKFTEKKLYSLLLSEVYRRIGEDKRFSRVSECGSFLGFRSDDGRLVEANFCKDRLCSMCNWRRSLKMFGQVSQVMDVLERDGYWFVFLSLTVKNCVGAVLSDTLGVLYSGWTHLRRLSNFKCSVVGAIRVAEITSRRVDDYHPHLHIVLAVKPSYFETGYITQRQWSDMWQSSCRLDYSPRCDVRAIKGGKKAVAEVSTYTVKGSDIFKGSEIDIDDTVRTLIDSLYRRRMVSWTGVFSKARQDLGFDDVEDGDLINTDNAEIRNDVAVAILRYGWRSGFYSRI